MSTFYAPGSPTHIDPAVEARARATQWNRHIKPADRVAAVNGHSTARPDPITEALDRFYDYRAQRAEVPSEEGPVLDRRRAALDLLLAETAAEIERLVDEHRGVWLAALADLDTEIGGLAAKTADQMDDATPELWGCHTVLEWLDRSADDWTNYQFSREPNLPTEHWQRIAAEIAAGDVSEDSNAAKARRFAGRSATASTQRPHATIPVRDPRFPKALAKPYETHRRHVDEYVALSEQRDALEAQRTDAQAADIRLLAESIATASGDPGTPNGDQLDERIADLDQRRADLAIQVKATFDTVVNLVDTHRADWRTATIEAGTTAATAWRQARDARDKALDLLTTVRATTEWLTPKPEDTAPSMAEHLGLVRPITRTHPVNGGDAA